MEITFFDKFWLVDGRFRIRIIKNNYGSGRPKNTAITVFRIRIRIDLALPDPDAKKLVNLTLFYIYILAPNVLSKDVFFTFVSMF